MAELVTFQNAPVVETVLSVGFQPIAGLHAGHLGRFWAEIANDYPAATESPRYNMPVEILGDSTPPQFQLEFGGPPTQPRVVLLSGDGSRLVQVQRDWLATNWRQQPINSEDSTYIRYADRRQIFETEVDRFSQFLQTHGAGQLVPRQAEITYINHITPNQHWDGSAKELDRVITVFGQSEFDLSGAHFSRLIRSDDQVVGRLHLNASMQSSDSGQPYLRLDLTARGEPDEPTTAGVLSFLDAGRAEIVTTFKNISTQPMHEAWELTK